MRDGPGRLAAVPMHPATKMVVNAAKCHGIEHLARGFEGLCRSVKAILCQQEIDRRRLRKFGPATPIEAAIYLVALTKDLITRSNRPFGRHNLRYACWLAARVAEPTQRSLHLT